MKMKILSEKDRAQQWRSASTGKYLRPAACEQYCLKAQPHTKLQIIKYIKAQTISKIEKKAVWQIKPWSWQINA